MRDIAHYIAGKSVKGTGSRYGDVFDPNTGKRIKRERDSTGDGRVDQWWTYNGDQVTIALAPPRLLERVDTRTQ